MSHIGKKIIPVPADVQITLKNFKNQGHLLEVVGKLGTLKLKLPFGLGIAINSKEIFLKSNFKNQNYPLWSTLNTLIHNLIIGVSAGFTKKLKLVGIGYRAVITDSQLVLKVGYSHDLYYSVPFDVTIECLSTQEILISGIDKQRVSQVAAEIRNFKKPESYKGTGILYDTEIIKLKQGKKK